jgi:DNA repair ATPase RecN
MNPSGPILAALTLPNGARFYRCVLQVNPHHYSGTYRGQPQSLNESDYVSFLIDKCIILDIRVIAITDHNHVGSIDLFKKQAQKHNIYVFPGFEIGSSEGVHILCIYPLDVTADKLSRYLGEFGIRDTDPSSKLSNKSFTDILRFVNEQGGVTIAAHITQDSGLLHVLHGQARINAWKDKNLMAVQIPGKVDDVPDDMRGILKNQLPEYRRARPASESLAVAILNSKDIVKPEDLEDMTGWCWVKMSEVSVEGLRQAFLDPSSRIRLSGDPSPEEHTEFLAVSWQGGFLDEAAIRFNENLNVLIGGRGTGKSTAVESLRYVLGLDPLGEDARKAHDGIVRQVLRSGTKISLLVRSHRPATRDYLIERTIPNPPLVRDETGNVLNLAPLDIIPQVEVYGQHEISELTKSREKLTHLLERFVERDPTVSRRKSELKRQLERSRGSVVDVRKEQKQIEERLSALPALEETLRRFQKAGLEERLKEQSLLVREERLFKTAAERVKPLREWLEQLQRDLPIDRTFLSSRALQDLPGREILSKLDSVLEKLSQEILALSIQMKQIIDQAHVGIESVRNQWEKRKGVVQAEYEKILRDLQKSKVDGEEFIRLRKQIEELRPLKERLSTLQRDTKEHEDHRRNVLAEWEDVKAEEFRQLERAAKKVSRKLEDRVKVEVISAGNREPLYQLLRDQVGGRLSEAIEILKQQTDLSLKAFADACREGRESLIQKFNIPLTQADRIAQAGPNMIMQIEELDLPPTTTIRLNVASEGQTVQWQTLDELSTGQKATAVLLLLLLESQSPLVVDQPEDDLDNRFITDGVVPKMREEKRRRQFIFATHNANIPVLGDAELIIGLTASGEADLGKAKLAQEFMGSIDNNSVRELVEEVLEGGKDAFEMRRLKYGF